MLMFCLSMLETEEDKITFERLYIEHKAAALQSALFVCNHNQSIAEDAVQDAFMQIIKGWKKYTQNSCNKWRSLIVIIAKNKAIDIMRRENRKVDWDDYAETAPDGEDKAAEAILAEKEDIDALSDHVSQLPDIYRIPLELQFVHDLGNQEIAKVLGISANAVGVRLHRARAMLGETIRKERAEQ
jgi:RNA polymerase sigma-70 factor (ECF subfamily)